MSRLADMDAIVARYAPALDSEMRAAVPALERSGLYGMLQYHLGWVDAFGARVALRTGKRLRPSLLLLSCAAAGGDWLDSVPAAAAVELLHNFSLIHDDIQDRSTERHHRAVVWSIWGTSQAINAGDALHAVASRAILRCVEFGAAPLDVIGAAGLLHECCLRLVEGQYLDLAFETRDDVTVGEYFEMIAGKTGALLATSIEIGAVLGGAGGARAHWRAFGEQVGRAFQIVDDVLGVWGDAALTGKPTADDVYKAKRSLPFLLARDRLGESDALRLLRLYQLPMRGTEEVAEAVELIGQSGARAEAERLAAVALDGGLASLAATGARGEAVEELRALARFVVSRSY